MFRLIAARMQRPQRRGRGCAAPGLLEPMMKIALPAALLFALLSAACLSAEEIKKLDLSTDKNKASYALGLSCAQECKKMVGYIDLNILAGSFHDALSGKKPSMSEDEMEKSMAEFRKFFAAKMLATGKGGAEVPAKLENKDKDSYAIGQSISERLQNFAEFLDVEIVCSAFISGARGEPNAINPLDHKAAIDAYLLKIAREFSDKIKKQSDEFLAENKKKEGVITTPTGLQYKILKEGKGEKASGTDVVSVNFEGRFITGKVFETTAKLGKPAETPLDGPIAGFVEALRLMPAGSKWQIYVPGDLGYGEMGRQGVVPPNCVLIFDIEVVGLRKVEPK